jgi:hypothetical protein
MLQHFSTKMLNQHFYIKSWPNVFRKESLHQHLFEENVRSNICPERFTNIFHENVDQHFFENVSTFLENISSYLHLWRTSSDCDASQSGNHTRTRRHTSWPLAAAPAAADVRRRSFPQEVGGGGVWEGGGRRWLGFTFIGLHVLLLS